jgi:hypothetical protein
MRRAQRADSRPKAGSPPKRQPAEHFLNSFDAKATRAPASPKICLTTGPKAVTTGPKLPERELSRPYSHAPKPVEHILQQNGNMFHRLKHILLFERNMFHRLKHIPAPAPNMFQQPRSQCGGYNISPT